MALPASKISPLGNYRQQPNQAYITTKPFNGKVFSYSTYVDSNFVTQGSLVANASYTIANSPAGRVLHANGRFLNTGVNPGVTKYYLGILDPATGLNGFIDPSDPTFAKYDVNLPVQYDLGTQLIPSLGGQGATLQVGAVAPYARFTATTSGTTLDVTAVTNGVIQVGMTLVATDATSLTGTRTISQLGTGSGGTGTYTLSGVAPADNAGLTVYGAQNGTLANPLNVNAGVVVCDGATPTVVYSSKVNTSSLVFLTQVVGSPAATTVTVSNGSFSIGGASIGVYNYLIVN
jgi:hypothetical protein